MKGVYIVVPVWGERYVQRWLRYGLASLLADGNLPVLAKVAPTKLLLCSTQEDLSVLLASPLLKAVRDLCGLRVVTLAQNAAELRGHKYNLMSVCHNLGLKQAWADDYGVIFGLADVLAANGSWGTVSRHIAAGRRAVLTQGLTVREELLDPLLAAHATRTETSLSVAPRNLVRIALEALHPLSMSQVWGAPYFTVHPSIMFWPLKGHGFLMRSWHLMPLFLHPDRQAQITTTADGDLLGSALSNPDDCACITDSDDGCFFDVAYPEKLDFIPAHPSTADPTRIAKWLETNTRPFNRDMIRHKFWFHDGIDPNDWRAVEEESDRAIEEVMRCYEQGTRVPVT
ncbi:MAG TPA: hypothetical protein VMQ11_01720 [Alphaproteobacteria bacterium]|nr:hypothetical protein [Alphaproteobacteria bacterium]